MPDAGRPAGPVPARSVAAAVRSVTGRAEPSAGGGALPHGRPCVPGRCVFPGGHRPDLGDRRASGPRDGVPAEAWNIYVKRGI